MDSRFVSSMGEEELSKFLSEINDDEDSTEFFQSEECKLPVDKKRIVGPPSNTKKVTYTLEERAELMRLQKSRNLAAKRQRVKEIKRSFVMSGRALELSKNIDKEVIKLIISHMTEEYYVKANLTKYKLTKYIEKELKRFIPNTLKVLYRTNNQAFAKYEGFEYVTSPYYGSMALRIIPDIPNVFSDPNEMQVLKAKSSHRLFTFDKLVERYYDLTKKRIQAEINLAIRLRNVRTVLDILDIGINYYEAYLHVTNSEDQKITK